MENQMIRIAAKFQYKIPSPRTLASMDTVSWSWSRPHRKTCTFLQKSWIRKATVDMNTFVHPQLRNWCRKPFSGKLLSLLLLLLLSMMILIIGFICPPTIHFKFITKCNKCYYKVRQVLQSATKHSLCSLFEPGEQPGTKKFSTLGVNLIKLLQG